MTICCSEQRFKLKVSISRCAKFTRFDSIQLLLLYVLAVSESVKQTRDIIPKLCEKMRKGGLELTYV